MLQLTPQVLLQISGGLASDSLRPCGQSSGWWVEITRRQVAERTLLLPSELPSLSQKVVMSSPSVGVCKLQADPSHGSGMLKGRALSKDRLDDPYD